MLQSRVGKTRAAHAAKNKYLPLNRDGKQFRFCPCRSANGKPGTYGRTAIMEEAND